MDSPDGDELFVIIDGEEAPPPRHRVLWRWGAAAGVLLLISLGAAVFLRARKPPIPPPVSAEAISFANADPIALEAPSPLAQPAEDDPPIAPPSIPSPTRAPNPPAPEAAPPTAPPPITADPPSAAVAEIPVPPPSPTTAKSVTMVELPAPSVSAPEEPVSVEKELATAATAISDATPIFAEIGDRFDPPTFQKGDVLELAAKMDRVEKMLRDAERIYTRVRKGAPDPQVLDRRLAMLQGLLESLAEGRARIRVPLALRKAEVLREEAVPLAKEALNGFQPFSREAQVLDVRAEVAVGKLREARRLYRSIQADVPDPDQVGQHVKDLDAQLEALEARYPEATQRADSLGEDPSSPP